ncbi:NtaA/DmoA family FMN-dependent monooxygenase [Achromobacter marplatensis]|uniref:NtaA/DmoA family FMN-dependent monooxygenase n=1 Tax=Achromobacter marplatensis TaxID=470868 RepID=UPI0028E9BC8F|nr:NtaA/DmoA family FMN-dependent monooxygenase [Achromobacter marplatensis]
MSGPGLILTAGVLGVGLHPAAWRYRRDAAGAALDAAYFQRIGQLAERGGLQAVFLADTLSAEEENFERPNLGGIDPVVALTAIAGVTSRVGLVATATTTYSDPFSMARRIASLDLISRGRAAWNLVTTFVPGVAANFGADPLPPANERYARAEEFIDVVNRLWRSWQPGALVGDKEEGVYADRSRISPIDHRGAHFTVRGPTTLPPSGQGRPVVFQSGASDAGRQLAARTADAIFTVQNTLASAQAFRRDIRERARRFRRDPNHIKVLPGLLAIMGGTEAEAKARKARLDELGGDAELKKLALRVGIPVERLQLDAPLPVDEIRANTAFRGSQGFRNAAIELGLSGKLTVREILYQNGGGHPQVVGTPEQVADHIEHWYREGAADGFNLMIDVLPDGLEPVLDELVPLLRQRGIFRREYRGDTLRTNLGLD